MKTNIYSLAFAALAFLKILLVVILNVNGTYGLLGGGNDADYYDAYALGNEDISLNIWPDILRLLNDIGIYSRQFVSNILVFISVIIIPLCVAKLAFYKNYPKKGLFWLIALYISIYPTIFYYSLDIYRDVFIVVVFLIGLISVKYFMVTRGTGKQILFFCLVVLAATILYFLRPYLGFSFIATFIFYNFYSFRKWPLFISLTIFLLSINVLFFIGVLDPLFAYRENFSDLDAGSNLSITFDSPSTFLLSFTKSFIFQIFGLYFSNISTIFVFIMESLPFAITLFYLIKNREFSNKFVDYLTIFFVVYTTIWLLGNDNLGTAVRLRIYSYISIFIACAIVFQKKKLVNREKYLTKVQFSPEAT